MLNCDVLSVEGGIVHIGGSCSIGLSEMYSEEEIGNAVDIVIGDDGSKGNQIIETLRKQYVKKHGKVMNKNPCGDYVFPNHMVAETITMCIGDNGFRSAEIINLLEREQ